jgi:hypothetical protein
LLEACEWLSLSYLNLKNGKYEEKQKLSLEIKKLSLEMQEFHANRMKKEKMLKSKVEMFEKSNSWKITSPLRKISYKLRNIRR